MTNKKKKKKVLSVSHSVMSDSFRPHDQAPLSMGFFREEY